MNKVINDHQCFVCGSQNPHGLQLDFAHDSPNQEASSSVTFPPHHQGWAGIVHGGLVSTVLDEAMVKAATSCNLSCITAELTVRFKKPTHTGVSYQLTGKILEKRGKILLSQSQLRDSTNTIVAEAKGKLFLVVE